MAGESARGWELTTQALAIAREVDDAEGIAFALNFLGNAAHGEGRLREAADYWQQSIEAFDRAGISGVAAPMYNLGHARVALGDLNEAQAAAGGLIDLGQSDDPWAAAKGHLLAAMVDHARGDLDEAEDEARAAEALFVRQGVAFHAADALLIQTGVAELRGDVTEARHLIERAREMLEGTGGSYDEDIYLIQARIALRERTPGAAVDALMRAFESHLGPENPIMLMALFHESARLAMLQERFEDAVLLVGANRARRAEEGMGPTRHVQDEEASIEIAAVEAIGSARRDELLAEGMLTSLPSAGDVARNILA